MYKKGLTLLMTALVMVLLSNSAYAGIQLNPVDDGDIILIEPEIGSEHQVIVRDSLAISIRADGGENIGVSLYKVMPSISDDDLDDVFDEDMIKDAEEIPFALDGGELVERDLESYESDEESDEPDTLSDRDISEEDSSSVIDGSELIEKDRLSSKDRQSIIEAFNDADDDFEDAVDDLEDAYEDYSDYFSDGHDAGHAYSKDELKAIKKYLESIDDTKEAYKAYKSSLSAYKAIFEIPLFGPESLTSTGKLPYYQKTVKKISTGSYKFVFSDLESLEIVEEIEFEVQKKEEITEEDIKEAVPEVLDNLITPNVDENSDDESEKINSEADSEDKEQDTSGSADDSQSDDSNNETEPSEE